MIKWIFAGIIIAVPVLMTGFTYFLFHMIFYKPKRSSKVPKAYMETLHYKVSHKGVALMKTIPSEDCYITSRDGLKLHAYLYPSDKDTGKKKFMIGIHGYKSYARPQFGAFIDFYRAEGYTMVLPDDRAHGPSEGTYIGFGVLDRLDCVDWARYLVERFGEDIEILLHGVSMGSSTVLAASAEADLPSQVMGVIADCGFTSAEEELGYELKSAFHIPLKPFLPWLERICERRIGIDFHTYSAIEQVKKAAVPILFVHGSKDLMVPVYMAQKLYDACSSRKQLLIVKDAGHGESVAYDPESYYSAVRDFFNL